MLSPKMTSATWARRALARRQNMFWCDVCTMDASMACTYYVSRANYGPPLSPHLLRVWCLVMFANLCFYVISPSSPDPSPSSAAYRKWRTLRVRVAKLVTVNAHNPKNFIVCVRSWIMQLESCFGWFGVENGLKYWRPVAMEMIFSTVWVRSDFHKMIIC